MTTRRLNLLRSTIDPKQARLVDLYSAAMGLGLVVLMPWLLSLLSR